MNLNLLEGFTDLTDDEQVNVSGGCCTTTPTPSPAPTPSCTVKVVCKPVTPVKPIPAPKPPSCKPHGNAYGCKWVCASKPKC